MPVLSEGLPRECYEWWQLVRDLGKSSFAQKPLNPAPLLDFNGILGVFGQALFKARKPLEIHSVVEFDLPVVVPEKGEFPDGGMICWYEDLFLHPYLEVCLNGSPPLCTLALDLHQIISEPTETPVNNF